MIIRDNLELRSQARLIKWYSDNSFCFVQYLFVLIIFSKARADSWTPPQRQQQAPSTMAWDSSMQSRPMSVNFAPVVQSQSGTFPVELSGIKNLWSRFRNSLSLGPTGSYHPNNNLNQYQFGGCAAAPPLSRAFQQVKQQCS
jgi:hypothetical protein